MTALSASVGVQCLKVHFLLRRIITQTSCSLSDMNLVRRKQGLVGGTEQVAEVIQSRSEEGEKLTGSSGANSTWIWEYFIQGGSKQEPREACKEGETAMGAALWVAEEYRVLGRRDTPGGAEV